MSRIIISICGGSGSGKSSLAKALVEHLGSERACRVSTDFFLCANRYASLAEFFRHPLEYDWELLAACLAGPDGLAQTTPQYDFIRFQRIAPSGGRPFCLRPLVIIDGMLPYPHADYSFLMDTPDAVRRRRIIARDIEWGTRVIDYWPQHQRTLARLKQSRLSFSATLSGLAPLQDNLKRVVDLYTAETNKDKQPLKG